MDSKQKGTLQAIFYDPIKVDIKWAYVVSLFRALGADLQKGRGRIEDVRAFLRNAGVEPWQFSTRGALAKPTATKTKR